MRTPPDSQPPRSRPDTSTAPRRPPRTRGLTDLLRTEQAGAGLLLAGAVVALLWANSPWHDAYTAVSDLRLGPAAIGLDLTVATWAQDGLLTIFFFVVGLELKREVVEGSLRRPSTAVVPIVAAVGGMAAPALIYLAINLTAADGAPRGWAVPVATDIAFAVAVLSLFGRGLPVALRAFLLTLAVVDDLLGIVAIAVFYTSGVAVGWLALAGVAVAVFAAVTRARPGAWWALVPVALAAWAAMHASGVHATIAGVLLGLSVPVAGGADGSPGVAQRWLHRWSPLSAGLAVPLFALFAAGVRVDGGSLASAAADAAAQGIVLGLVVGKPVGIVLTTALLVATTRARLAPELSWWDVLAMSCVAGIGFTVALLIAGLSFDPGTERAEIARAAVLVGSLLSAVIGAVALTVRSRLRARTVAAAT